MELRYGVVGDDLLWFVKNWFCSLRLMISGCVRQLYQAIGFFGGAMQVGSALYVGLLKDSRVLVRQSETEMLRSIRTNTSLPFSFLVADVIRGAERVIERTQAPSSADIIALQISALS